MLGQLVCEPGGRGRPEPERLYGLNILRGAVDPDGFFGEGRLRRTVRNLRRGGVLRVLTAPGFDRWPLLTAFGLRPVEPEGFVRGQAVPLTLAVLERQGVSPDRATVALRGPRANRDMARAAAALCPRVRRLVIDAPRGGTELAEWLRREFGVPVLPGGERGALALSFQAGQSAPEETALELYGPRPGLAGLRLSVPRLAEGDRENLPLLAALWEGGRLAPEDVKIT